MPDLIVCRGEDGKLARAGKGDRELLETFPPPRPISKTELSNGLARENAEMRKEPRAIRLKVESPELQLDLH